MARATFVKKARKDILDYDGNVKIAKGESYWRWKFRFGGKHTSKEKPRRSQLTQSAFYGQMYDLEDRIAEITAESPEDLESEVQDIISELENLGSECQDSLDSMPQHLQESSSSGELLQSRVEACESAASEFESIDLDYEEPDDEDIRADLKDDATDEDVENAKAEKLQEWLDEKIGEVQDVAIDYE